MSPLFSFDSEINLQNSSKKASCHKILVSKDQLILSRKIAVDNIHSNLLHFLLKFNYVMPFWCRSGSIEIPIFRKNKYSGLLFIPKGVFF